MVTAVPAPMMREPQFLGPAFYAAGVVYSLSINFAQVALAFHIDDGEARVQMFASTVYAIVAASVGVAMVGAALVLAMMEPRYRKTFYQHRTMKTYLTEWNCTLATHGTFGVGHDACFAELFVHYSPYHWPAPEMLRAWLAQWPEWERAADPPSWFTEEWQRHVLGEVLFTASATVGTAWLVSECLVLLALRMVADAWRGWTQALDSVSTSLMLHTWECIMGAGTAVTMIHSQV